MTLLTLLQAAPPEGTWAWIVGGLAFAVTSIAIAYSKIQYERLKDKDIQIDELQASGEKKDSVIADKENKIDDLVTWTRLSSEKTIENYAKIISILEKLSEDKGQLQDGVAKELSSQLQQLRFEFSREFSELKILLNKVL